MTKLKYTCLVCVMLLVVLTVVIASNDNSAGQRPTPAEVGLPTWEYRIFSERAVDPSSVEARANALGVQGFELIKFEVIPIDDGRFFSYHLVFRRQKR